MTTIGADEFRIPRRAREAVARHQEVVVLNRERPAFVILHPDDHASTVSGRRGRRLRDALARLESAAWPDPRFADDMDSVLGVTGSGPGDPWEPL